MKLKEAQDYTPELTCAYNIAKQAIVRAGFEQEVVWQSTRSLNNLSEQSFLREAAWAILSGGMRESIIKKKFPGISQAFCSWQSADVIVKNVSRCRNEALDCFNHPGKVNAVIEVAQRVVNQGFDQFQNQLRNRPIDFLQEFSYLGPATARHLAKNIGVQVAKPDRHLQRIASIMGYSCAQSMCQSIATAVSDDVAIVDLVIWRYATLDKDYLEFFGMARPGGQFLEKSLT